MGGFDFLNSLFNSSHHHHHHRTSGIKFTKEQLQEKLKQMDIMLADPNSGLSEAQKKAMRQSREYIIKELK